MVKWEYRTVQIRYDRKKQKTWVVERAEEPPLVGLQAIVDAHGTRGQELASPEPEHFGIYATSTKWHMEPAAEDRCANESFVS